jgi:hypothetical protein
MQLVQKLSFNVLFKGYTSFRVLCTSHYTTASGDALSSVFFSHTKFTDFSTKNCANSPHSKGKFFPTCRIFITGSSVLVGSQEYRSKIYVRVY